MSWMFFRKNVVLASALSAVFALTASNVLADPPHWTDGDGIDEEHVVEDEPSVGFGALIVNEYNCVDEEETLAGFDPAFGNGTTAVIGNGGNWIELVVRGDGSGTDTVNLQDLVLEWRNDDEEEDNRGWVQFSDDEEWTAVPAGTIITIIEADTGLTQGPTGTPGLYRSRIVSGSGGFLNAGWINQPIDQDTYIDHGGPVGSGVGSFKVDNDGWKMRILQYDGTNYRVVQDWVGESSDTWNGGGINSREIAKAEIDVTEIDPFDNDGYDDGDNSTFGAPNTVGEWVQDF